MTTQTTEPPRHAYSELDIRRALAVLRPDLDYAEDAGNIGTQVLARAGEVRTLAALLPPSSPIHTEVEAAEENARKSVSSHLILQTTSLKTLIAAGTAKLEKQP